MKHLAHRLTICEQCLQPTFGELFVDNGTVLLEKSCAHPSPCNSGRTSRSLISSDADYFLQSWISGSTAPTAGLSALIIEVTDDCNLRCPTCIAGSEPGAGNTRNFELLARMIGMAENQPRKPDILMISGGEPTIHPDIIRILHHACESSIDHVMLITNGKRIAEDASFARDIGALRGKLEIYLQFDSLRPDVLRDIRGADLSSLRLNALERLQAVGLPVTLVCVVKEGLNDLRCDEVIQFALGFQNIRGVTFQPIKAAGRTDSLVGMVGTIDLARVRNSLIRGKSGIGMMDMIPHPLNSENIAIAYLHRENDRVRPVTTEIFRDVDLSRELGRCLYFLPKHDTDEFRYNDLVRVTIVAFMDKYTFFHDVLSHAAIGFITPSGAVIPLDSYYTHGRPSLSSLAA